MQDNLSPEQILEMQRKNCIFCKIIKKEIPSHEIYSDEQVVVILDINPAAEGHCLVMPREHYQILPQIPGDIIQKLFIAAKKTSRSLLKALAVKGTSIFVANGAVAGQKAPHFMIHVIPRQPGDMLFQMPKNKVETEKLKEVQAKLSQRLGSLMGKPVQPEESPKAQENPVKEPKQNIDLDKISGLFDG